MKKVNDMLKTIDKKALIGSQSEILGYLGVPAHRDVPPRVLSILEEELLEGKHMAEPQGIWETVALEEGLSKHHLILDGYLVLESQDLRGHLHGFSEGVLMGVTIGPRLEKQVETLFQKREHTRAAILDAVGSQLVEEAADELTAMFFREKGLSVAGLTRRYSPGYGDWRIGIQPRLLEKLDAHRIGLSCNEAAILIPRKSITAMAGYRLSE